MRRRAGSAALALALLGGGVSAGAFVTPASATDNGSVGRTNTVKSSPDDSGPVKSNPHFYAYVEPGATLSASFRAVWESVNNSDPDPVSVRLVIRDSTGRIVKDVSAPITKNNTGSAPVVVSADRVTGESGRWSVEFTSPDADGRSTSGVAADWSITPTSSAGNAQSGRVFTDVYRDATLFSRGLEAEAEDKTLYYLDNRGAQYRGTYRDYMGGNSRFSADSMGLGDSSCNPLYKSQPWALFGGGSYKRAADCPSSNTFMVYFEKPDPTMPPTTATPGGTTWLYTDYVAPSVSKPDYRRSATGRTAAGDISYTLTGQNATAKVLIDTTGAGTFLPANTVVIEEQALVGPNTVAWDGLDKNGDPVKATQKVAFKVEIIRPGEIHFVNEDVERRQGGIEVVQLAGPAVGSTRLWWNDSLFKGQQCWDLAQKAQDKPCYTPNPDSTNTLVSDPNGTDSAGGVHGWASVADNTNTTYGMYGDVRAIDDWTYLDDSATSETLVTPGLDPLVPSIDLVKSNTIADDKNSDGDADEGDGIQYTFKVTNPSQVTLDNVKITDPRLAKVGIGITCPQTTLAAGESMNCRADDLYRVTRQDVIDAAETGTILNTAKVTGDPTEGPDTDGDGNPDPVTDTDPSEAPSKYVNRLVLDKTLRYVKDPDGDQRADEGDQIVFGIKVTNRGEVTVTDVKITDEMLDEAGVKITCDEKQKSLAVGESTICESDPYTVTAADAKKGKIVNVAVSSATDPYDKPVDSNPDTVDTPTDPPTTPPTTPPTDTPTTPPTDTPTGTPTDPPTGEPNGDTGSNGAIPTGVPGNGSRNTLGMALGSALVLLGGAGLGASARQRMKAMARKH